VASFRVTPYRPKSCTLDGNFVGKENEIVDLRSKINGLQEQGGGESVYHKNNYKALISI